MLLLDFFYYIIILEIFICLHLLLETILTYSETWLLYDQVWILFFFFYHTGCNVTVDQIVGADWRHHFLLINYLPLYLWFEWWCHFLLNYVFLRIVRAGTWQLIFILFFASHLGWTELASITSLDLVDQLVFHGIPGFIWARSRYFHIRVDDRRTPAFFLDLGYLFSLRLLTKLKANIVASWPDRHMGSDGSWSLLKPLTHAKASGSFSSFRSADFTLFKIGARTRSSLVNVLILTIIRIRVNMCWTSPTFLR